MSDYKELSKKLLENRKISVYDYYNEIVAKNYFKIRYEEELNANANLDDTIFWFQLLLPISIGFNISFLIMLFCG